MFENPLADSAPPVRRRDSDLVDPELARLGGVVTGVVEELAREGGIDLVIEDILSDAVEDADVVATEETDLYHGSKQS